jgi:hypothetical protein
MLRKHKALSSNPSPPPHTKIMVLLEVHPITGNCVRAYIQLLTALFSRINGYFVKCISCVIFLMVCLKTKRIVECMLILEQSETSTQCQDRDRDQGHITSPALYTREQILTRPRNAKKSPQWDTVEPSPRRWTCPLSGPSVSDKWACEGLRDGGRDSS